MDAKANPPVGSNEEGDDTEKFQVCLDAAIAESATGESDQQDGCRQPGRKRGELKPARTDWRTSLRQVRRERLDQGLRTAYDELLIDALEQVGQLDVLQSSLATIPPEEAGPRVWQAQELCTFDRLSRLAQDRSSETFDAALRIWDEAMGLSWPRGIELPRTPYRASRRHDRH